MALLSDSKIGHFNILDVKGFLRTTLRFLISLLFTLSLQRGVERKPIMINIPLLQYSLVVMEAYQNTTDCTYGTYGGDQSGKEAPFYYHS